MEIQELSQGARPPWSIGEVARRSGLPVKTVRFYADAGLLDADRTVAGHRRFGQSDLARLTLIRGLRSLDVPLDRIAELVGGARDLAQTLRAHESVLELRLRSVRRQLAVCRAAGTADAERTSSRLHLLVRVEAAEREQLLDRFWDRVLAPGTDPATAEGFRRAGTPELPDEPTAEQLDAWLELAELAVDRDFQETTRRNATWFWDLVRPGIYMRSWSERLGAITASAIPLAEVDADPTEPSAAVVVDAFVASYADAFGRTDDPAFRGWLADRLDAATDPRAARWWELVAIVQPPEDPMSADGMRRFAAAAVWLHAAVGGGARG